MSNPKSFLPPELKRSIDLLTAKLPEIQAFAEQQTAKAQEIIDACSAFPRQIGLPSIPSSTTSKEEPGGRQHAYAISLFPKLGQGPTFIAPGPHLPMFCHVEQFGHLARTQLNNWEELESAGWEYAGQFSTDENGEEDEYGLGADIRTIIREADHCWRRKWIQGVFQFHPTIQTPAELRSWCQLQFEAIRVLDDLRILADYQSTYDDRPQANCGRKRDPVFSLEVWRQHSADTPPEGSIHFTEWTCEDTIRLALPALYELDLPQTTRTDALVKMLEDRHFRDVVGRALTWSEWTRHVQKFREETYGLCPSKCHDQPITFGGLFERAWEYMRKMPGRFLPKEPCRVTTLGNARRQLDKVIHWCDQEAARLNRGGISTPARLANLDDNNAYEAGEQSQADGFRRILEESQKYKKGPRSKAKRTERRDELITQAIGAGMSEPEQIFEFIKGQSPELVKSGKSFINPQIMMKKYWKRQRAKGQLHQAPAQQN